MERLIEKHIPDISELLKEKEITCELFAVRWFITLFSYDFEPPYLYILWDLFILNGWEYLFSLALSILKEVIVYGYDSESLLQHIKSMVHDNPSIQSSILNNSLSFRVTKEDLLGLEKEYNKKNDGTIIIKTACNKPNTSMNTERSKEKNLVPAKELHSPLTSRQRVILNKGTQLLNTEEEPAIRNLFRKKPCKNYTKPKMTSCPAHKERPGSRNAIKVQNKYNKLRIALESPSESKSSSHNSCNVSTSTLNSHADISAKIPYSSIRNHNQKKFVFETSSNKVKNSIKSAGNSMRKGNVKVIIVDTKSEVWSKLKRGIDSSTRNNFKKIIIN